VYLLDTHTLQWTC